MLTRTRAMVATGPGKLEMRTYPLPAIFVDLAGVGASVILPGLYGAQTEVPLLLDQAVFREIRLIGVFSHDCRAVTAAIEMVKRKRYPFRDMISHRLPLEKARHALALVGGELPGETCMKVVLEPSMSA